MAKKEAKHSIEGIISETYPYPDEKLTRIAVDGDSTRLETWVPMEFGGMLKMGDKVSITIEKAQAKPES